MPPKQTTGLHRNTIDKYYTADAVVALCLAAVAQHVDIAPGDVCIEPSAGNGAFIAGIKTLFTQYMFYDIAPEHPEIVCHDYLAGTSTAQYAALARECARDNARVHVIGNPPFGRQASLASRFIKTSCEFCTSVSFILPRSFKKASRRKTVPANFYLACELDLPRDAFLVDGQKYSVPCVFQIWTKQPQCRSPDVPAPPVGFAFTAKSAAHDISVRRVGVNAGRVCLAALSADKSEQSHYFIAFCNSRPLEANVSAVCAIMYDDNNTVGPKSISKQELISKFNAVLAPTLNYLAAI